jgi:hypothetical protein
MIRLPRREPLVEMFAKHMAADAKVLDEDPDAGTKKSRYVRVGEDHFSLAFTYAMMGVNDQFWRSLPVSRMTSESEGEVPIGVHGRRRLLARIHLRRHRQTRGHLAFSEPNGRTL